MELVFENLTKKYGDKCALTDFSAVLHEGIYGILGPNGSGKSTLMNCITDNVKRTSGEILFDGEEILKLGRKFRGYIGYMPQQQGFYENFTAMRFLYYLAGLKGLKKKEAKKQIKELLDIVGLSADADRRLGGYSGGMRQRVLLASALIGNPKIVIMDEPTAGLDPEERIRTRNLISKIAQDKIIILATHVVSDIECIANQVLMMSGGKLIRQDTPYALMNSVKDKVYEKICTMGEAEEYQKMYRIGNIYQRHEGLVLRIVNDTQPEGFERVKEDIGLEDVYLYYLKKREVQK